MDVEWVPANADQIHDLWAGVKCLITSLRAETGHCTPVYWGLPVTSTTHNVNGPWHFMSSLVRLGTVLRQQSERSCGAKRIVRGWRTGDGKISQSYKSPEQHKLTCRTTWYPSCRHGERWIDDDDVLTLDSLGLVHCSGTWMLCVLASSQTPSCMGSLKATSSMESTNGQDTSP